MCLSVLTSVCRGSAVLLRRSCWIQFFLQRNRDAVWTAALLSLSFTFASVKLLKLSCFSAPPLSVALWVRVCHSLGRALTQLCNKRRFTFSLFFFFAWSKQQPDKNIYKQTWEKRSEKDNKEHSVCFDKWATALPLQSLYIPTDPLITNSLFLLHVMSHFYCFPNFNSISSWSKCIKAKMETLFSPGHIQAALWFWVFTIINVTFFFQITCFKHINQIEYPLITFHDWKIQCVFDQNN